MSCSSTWSPPPGWMRTVGSPGCSDETGGGGGSSGRGSSLGGCCAARGSETSNSAGARIRRSMRRKSIFRRVYQNRCAFVVLEIEQDFALGGARLEAPVFVMFEDRLDHAFGLVDDLDQLHVLRVDHVLPDEPLAHPVKQSAPERRMHEYARHARALARLHEHEHLRKFIERPEAARQKHVGARAPHEHRLAREKMPEQQGYVLVSVAE